MTEVILKSELHSSRLDKEEELEIMEEGVDALVLEGEDGPSDYRISESWFEQAITGLFYVGGPIYQSADILIRFARYQGAELYLTRESDAEILRNAPLPLRVLGGIAYLVLLMASIVIGLMHGFTSGAIVLFAAFVLPTLSIRLYNTKLNSTDNNRDQIIAQRIEDAANDHERILAIVGAGHANGVQESLPEDYEIDFRKSSATNLGDISVFLLSMVDVLARLFFLYAVILGVFLMIAMLIH